jgi:type IV pilus biogenesis protein CpaD/CtpE
VAVLLQGCKTPQLEVDPCGVYPDDRTTCHAVPLNEEKPEYDRPIMGGDICVTLDEYAKIQKYYRDMMKRCGDRCK